MSSLSSSTGSPCLASRVTKRKHNARGRFMTLWLELQRLLKEILAKNSRDAIRA